MIGIAADMRDMVVSAWCLSPEQADAVGKQDPTWARSLSLSLGISSALGESPEAEERWMAASRKAFGGRSARDVLTEENGLAKVEQLFYGECP